MWGFVENYFDFNSKIKSERPEMRHGVRFQYHKRCLYLPREGLSMERMVPESGGGT